MRDDIHSVIEEFRKGRVFLAAVPEQAWRDLERELLIVASTPDPLRRDQEYIDRRVSAMRAKLAPLDGEGREITPLPDPRLIFERFLNGSKIDYLDQKLLQWMVAYIYRAGFEHGKERGMQAGPAANYRIEGQ